MSEPTPEPEVIPDPLAQPDANKQPEMDPAGFPKGVAWRDMSVDHQSAYWRHQAKRHEAEKKAAFGERDALRADADAFRALDESTKSEELKQRERAERERDEALKQIDEQRRTFGSQLVQTKLSAAAAGKGMTPDALATLAGDPTRFLVDGGVDDEALGAFLAALPDAKPGAQPLNPSSLGGGRRQEAKTDPLSAGEARWEARHKRKSSA